MKLSPLALVFALTILRAAEAPLPEFGSNAIETPPLSLRELGRGEVKPMRFGSSLPSAGKIAAGGLLGELSRPASARLASPPPRFTQKSPPGQMPILEPNPSIDYKIVLKEPEPAIDPRMLVAPPNSPKKTAPSK